MSKGVTLIVKKTVAEPAAASEAKDTGAPELGRAPETIQNDSAKTSMILGGAGLVLAATVLLSVFAPASTAILASDKKEGISAATLRQLETNRAMIEKKGIKAGNVQMRDWGAIDGDAAIVNGSFVGPLQAEYQTISVGQGAVKIAAKAGAVGCVTLEVADSEGAVYQVCVNDGDPISTIAR